MADWTRGPRDEYGFGLDFGTPATGSERRPAAPPTPFVTTPVARNPDGTPAYAPMAGVAPLPGENGSYYATYPRMPWAPEPTVAPVTPPGPAAFAGSPLNTLYGIDSESNLTDDQRKLARMIQGKFDASLNRRDRELAQYGAPQLASFVEDEALARAMALARGLNIPVQNALGIVQGSGPASRGGTGGGGGGGTGVRQPTGSGSLRNPNALRQNNVAARTTPPGASPSQASKWQQIMGGLSSILPLLIGKEGMSGLMNQGLVKWVGDKFQETFGSVLDPRAAEILVNQSVAPTDGGLAFNPITGMPIAPGYGAPQDIWGDYTRTDELVGPPAYLAGGEEPFTDYGPGTEPGWGGGGDWWTGGGEGGTDWWGGGDEWWAGGGGDEWWGDVWEPAGGWADTFDPYAIGGW